jgi:hypothetical protein
VTQPPFDPYPRSHEPGLPYPTFPAQSDRYRQLPPPSKTLAGWSLGLAIFPSVITWIIAVAFACTVISNSKDGREHGKGMAVAALIIVGAWVAVAIIVVAVVFATGAERDDSGRVTDGGRATIVDLHVGDCLQAPDESDQAQLTVQVVPCGNPHDAEVYANFDLDEWTSADEVDRISEAGCLERFSEYVGVPARKSTLDVLYFVPTSEVSFNKDSAVVCILISPEPVNTSLEGSKR